MESWFTNIKWKMPELRYKKEKTLQKVDYKAPKPSIKEELFCAAEGCLVIAVFSYFFYKSIYAFFIMIPGIWLYRKEKQKTRIKKRKEKLEAEFKETMLAVQTNLQSGYSMENAFLESHHYIVGIFGENCDMARELLWIKKRMSNGDTLEHLLLDLGRRCPDSAIEDFAYVYSIAGKTGGNWNEVIGRTVTHITQRIEIKEEISVMIHGKKMESRIMCLIPFFILFYMDVTSKGYLDVMYHNIIGIVVMTVCMAVYIFAFWISEKITDVM